MMPHRGAVNVYCAGQAKERGIMDPFFILYSQGGGGGGGDLMRNMLCSFMARFSCHLEKKGTCASSLLEVSD